MYVALPVFTIWQIWLYSQQLIGLATSNREMPSLDVKQKVDVYSVYMS